MSELPLISPLLDDYIVGDPMSEHHGVRCCPALHEDTGERHIVKIISIPASQVQLDALLLTGAYENQAQALAYFHELAQGVAEEADILSKLNKLEGFLPYSGCQIEKMDNGVGYRAYLISPYRRSLEKQMRQTPLTHLGAVNLGLDLCAALAICRRAGFLYLDLKPSNIFMTENQGYRIGDLGFIALDSLKYASLPEKYRSSYTAPEISDAFASLNHTMDIYALGLVLYQVYNNGQLPFEGTAPSEVLPPPQYADYEMAEIILKACAPNPLNRWQDPAQMGKALVNYMQRNSVNDTPIVPPPVEIPEEPAEEVEQEEAFLSEDENEAELAALLDSLTEEEPPVEEKAVAEEVETEESQVDDEADISFIEDLTSDETAPTEESAAELDESAVTDEVAEMLAQADDLIDHELPEPAVAPDPIDIPFPPPIVLEPAEKQEEFLDDPDSDTAQTPEPDEPASEEETEVTDGTVSAEFLEEEPDEDDPDDYVEHVHRKKKGKVFVPIIIAVALLVALALGGYFFYTNYYLQTINAVTVDGTVDQITVQITSDIDESLLTVICTDTYGSTRFSAVNAGKASFTELTANTQYNIQVNISGFHKLQGSTTATFTTGSQTEILNFGAIAGVEDGSVILSFAVNGVEAESWSVEYFADGEPTKSVDFTGHTVSITGLAVGTEYTFRLSAKHDMLLTGDLELNHTASQVVCAQDLTIDSCGNGLLHAVWTVPEGLTADGWTVRCYNGKDYDQTITTKETFAQFTDLDHSSAYTVQVVAVGMTQSVTAAVTANPITVTMFTASTTLDSIMQLYWEFEGEPPANGWLVNYKIDGVNFEPVTCANSMTYLPAYPNSHYEIEVQPVDKISFYQNTFTYDTEKPSEFEGYGVKAADMAFRMCNTPNKENWDRHDLDEADFSTTFEIGKKASFLVRLLREYTVSEDEIATTFVIRDAEGKPVSIEVFSRKWIDMWYQGYCELDLHQMPATAGNYTVEIYFNSMYVTTQAFTIE